MPYQTLANDCIVKSMPAQEKQFAKLRCEMPFGLKTKCFAFDAFKILKNKHSLSPLFEGYAFPTN